jgi:hypothetical protein
MPNSLTNPTPKKFFEDVTKTFLVLRPKLGFDWLPTIEDGRMTFLARLDYQGHEKTAIDFQVDWNRLSVSEKERLHTFINRRHAGITTHPEMAYILVWLLDLSLAQNEPNFTTEERQLQILRLLLITPQDKKEPSSLGVSPLLIFVSRHARNRLEKKHGITVEELERESAELFAGLKQFEKISAGPDAQTSAELYNRLIIAHHEKVKHLGNLLGGQVGEALSTQARLAIEELSSPL